VVCDGAGAPLRALLRGRRRRLRLMPERPDEPKPRPARRPSKEPAEQPATEPQPPAKGPTKKPRQRKKRLSTEKVEWMKGLQGEVLAVLLRGDVVGPHSVPTGVAGPFLNRLHELTQSVAGVLVGRQSGRRGPLREVPGAGLLALGGVEWGRSAALHF